MAHAHVDGPAADAVDEPVDEDATVDGAPNEDISWPRIAAAIVLTVLFTFWMFDRAPASHAGGDSLWVVHTSASLITDGDFDLTEYSPLIDAYSIQPPPHLMEVESGRVDFFPWGASVVATPFVVGHAAVTYMTGGDFAGELETTLPLFEVENNVASAIAALTVGLLLLVLYLRMRSLAWAMGLAVVFAFGTSVMSTSSRNMWIQGPGLLLVVGVLLLGQLLSERDGEVTRADTALVAASGAVVVLAYATRPSLALLGVVMLVLAWNRGRWRLAGTLVGVSVVGLVVFAAINVNTYGEWLPPYYRDRLDLSGTFPEALAANLVSPARGLFVWSPLLLVGVLWCIVRWGDTTLFERLLLGWAGAHLLAISAFPHWWAGASVGPRLMLDVVPALFVLLTAPIVELRRRPARVKQAAFAALAVATLWAGFVNVRAGYRISVMLWNWPSAAAESIEIDPGRVWDWTDPQFLR